jgi:hypothetical protein
MCSENRISRSPSWFLAAMVALSTFGLSAVGCAKRGPQAPARVAIVSATPPPPRDLVATVSVPPPRVNLHPQWPGTAAAWKTQTHGEAEQNRSVREPFLGQPSEQQSTRPSSSLTQAPVATEAVDDVPAEDEEQIATINAEGQPEVAPATDVAPANEGVDTTTAAGPPNTGASAPVQPLPAEPVVPQGEEFEDRDPSALSDFDPYLRDYGVWVDHPHYGTVWVPAHRTVGPKFVPYVSSGHWALTSAGDWVWESDHPFGWVVFHYGRWIWTSDYGWVWIAGRRYAPAWVRFRTFGQPYVGWGPLPPMYIWRGGVAVSLGVYYPVPYVFAPWGHCFSPSLTSYIIWERHRVRQMARRSRPLVGRGEHRRVLSPSVRDIPQEARPKVRVAPDPRAIGLARRSPRDISKPGELSSRGTRPSQSDRPDHQLPGKGPNVDSRERAKALGAVAQGSSGRNPARSLPGRQTDRQTAAANMAEARPRLPTQPRLERKSAAANLANRKAAQQPSASPRSDLKPNTWSSRPPEDSRRDRTKQMRDARIAPPRIDQRTKPPARSEAPKPVAPNKRVEAPRRAEAPRRVEAPRRADTPKRNDAPRRTELPRRSEAPRRMEPPRRIDPPRRSEPSRFGGGRSSFGGSSGHRGSNGSRRR